ncbi:MAG TPA: ATP-binding protein, partial [Burkholderiales bacterium]|nr:ATP-binding protein [Burkholderiales bacterium]
TGVVKDITLRKEAEDSQARLIHELESANEELKNFAYVVSHDLKAPLRAIGSLADWISTDQSERLDDDGREHLRLLIQRARRMDSLIDGILQYSRVGRVRETKVEVDMNEIVKESLAMLAPPPNIRVKVAPGLPFIDAERTRMIQLFQNLLSNAIKYLDKPEGLIHIGFETHEDDWEFSVSDNGCGIEPRHFKRIFQLFQTLLPKDRVESTGVGLALVKKIVELYGGRIWVESVPSVGSTFFFTLPRSGTTQQEHHL